MSFSRRTSMSRVIFLTVFSLAWFATLSAQAQQVFKTTSPSVIAYLEYLPDGYDSNSDKYPVVVFLHGIGERGPNTTDVSVLSQYIGDVAKNGPPMLVKNGTKFPFILISPQLKNNYGDWPSTYVMEVINHCKTYLRIDERRIYLTGLSLGGGGTWWTAQDYPKTFAAIAPVCGSRNTLSKAVNIAAENLPVWAFHGDADGVVALSRSLNMVNAINACIPTPDPRALLTIYPGVGHNSWDNAYKADNSIHNPNVYEWMLAYTNTRNGGNEIPVANAGPDQTLTIGSLLASVNLTGLAIDTDGLVISYAWTKISGPDAILAGISLPTLTLSGLTAGDYVFKLKVTDNNGNSDSDYVRIKVQTNATPVANAGPDQSLTLPSNSLTLAGSGTDSDGAIQAYTWTQVSGGACSLNNTSAAELSVSGLTEGTYVYRLAVDDNAGATATDDVTVTVVSAPAPARPSVIAVNAGLDKIVKLPTTSTTLTSTVSGATGTLSYQWTKISGGSCTMTYANTSKLSLKQLTSGVYVFRITVTDSEGYTANDDVKVTVDAPPVVNAGADVTIALPANSMVLSGVATDADGTVVKYKWSKYSGPNISSSSGSTTTTFTVNGLVAGTYVFKLAATDNIGVTGIDYVTVTVVAETPSSP